MALAVQNLRIEILGQIFYASFMVYNALPMGAWSGLKMERIRCV